MCYYTDYFGRDLKTTVVPCINVSILYKWNTQEVKKYNTHLWQVQHCDHSGLVIVPLDCRDPQLLPDHWVWSICTDLRTNEKKKRKRQRKKGDRSMKIHSLCVYDGTDQKLCLNCLPVGQRYLDPWDGLCCLVRHWPSVLHHLGPVLDLHVI